jgi:hypothetical protein
MYTQTEHTLKIPCVDTDRLASLHGADSNLPESMQPPCAGPCWLPVAAAVLLVKGCAYGLIQRKALRAPIYAVCS